MKICIWVCLLYVRLIISLTDQRLTDNDAFTMHILNGIDKTDNLLIYQPLFNFRISIANFIWFDFRWMKLWTMTKPTAESFYDTRTLVFRTIVVVIYICFGSGIFHVLERHEPSRSAARFEEYYNRTISNILNRSISNDTEMKIVIAEIRRTFLQESYPTEWNFLGGVNISVQAITTIG